MVKGRRVWLYTRTARKDDNAMVEQMTALKDFAVQEGYFVIGASYDVSSGTRYNRRGLNQVKAFAAKGEIDMVLVTNMARIGRDVAKSVALSNMLHLHGVEVIALDMAFEPFPVGFTPGYSLEIANCLSSLDSTLLGNCEDAENKNTPFGDEVSSVTGTAVPLTTN